MIDDGDGDAAWVISLTSRGWWAVLALAVAIVLWLIAADNRKDCASKVCPAGQVGRVLDHECLCVGKP